MCFVVRSLDEGHERVYLLYLQPELRAYIISRFAWTEVGLLLVTQWNVMVLYIVSPCISTCTGSAVYYASEHSFS